MNPDDIDRDSPVPIYRQIVNLIAAEIKRGTLRPGARLPAERDLARQLGVSYLTVRRAMKDLRAMGLVESVVGKGTFIKKPD